MTTVLQIANQQLTGEELITFLSSSHLLPQVLREVIIEQAIAPIDYTPDELQSVYQQLENQKIFDENLETIAIRQLKIYKFQQINWGNQIESYFLSQKQSLERASFSLIQISDGEIAQEIYFRLIEDEQSFADLAKQYSQGAESQNSGCIGTLKLSRLHPKLAEILRTSQPGEISPLLYLEKIFIIVRLEKFFPAQLNQQIRQELLQELFEKWLQEQISQYKNSVCSEIISESIPAMLTSGKLSANSAAPISQPAPNLPETNLLVNLYPEPQKTQSLSLFSQLQKTKLAVVSFLCLLSGGVGGFYLSTLNLPLSYATLAPTVSKPDSFHTAINFATQAANLTQFAQCPTEWEQVAQSWKSAIALLKSLPKNHPRYTLTTQKINEYERNLNYAHKHIQNSLRLAVNHATTAANLTQTASSSVTVHRSCAATVKNRYK